MKLFLPILSILFPALLYSQIPGPCGSGADEPPGCYMCTPVYSGSNAGFTPGLPGPLFPCGITDNNVWFTFIADNTNVSATIVTSNCMNGEGLEMLIYDQGGNAVSTCYTSNGRPDDPGSVSGSGFIPGNPYFVMVDGYNGDECDFTVTISGSLVPGRPAPIDAILQDPDVPLCPGAVTSFFIPGNDPNTTDYTWTVSPGAQFLTGNAGDLVFVEFSFAIPVTICATPSNPCYTGQPTCITVQVEPIPPTILPPEEVCTEDFPIDRNGEIFPAPGVYIRKYQSVLGCDSLVTYNFVQIPPIPPTFRDPIFVCGEEFPVIIDGHFFNSPGSHEIVYDSYKGCDSSVIYLIFKNPQPLSVLDTILCEGECITVGTEIICEAGITDVRFENGAANGCDSLVRAVIRKLDPEAKTDSVANLSCVPGSTVQLDGTGSSTGSDISYLWRAFNGGNLVSTDTAITATADRQGAYVLAVTQELDDKYCTVYDTTIVQVNGIIPDTPVFVNPALEVCQGDITNYAIDPVANADSYYWEVTPPATFSGSGTGISVDWATATGSGEVCVTAINNCTDSVMTCIPVKINAIPTAAFSSDAPKCIDSLMTFTYTGTANTNALFDWTFTGGTPAGASGAGPHQAFWSTAGSRDVHLVVTANGCVSPELIQQVRIENPLPAPVINCNSTVNSVDFNWGAVPGAALYEVIINGASQGTQTNTTYTVGGLSPNDSINITVIATGTSACGPSQATSFCKAQNCPPVTLTINPVADICLNMATIESLTYQTSGGAGNGTAIWSGPGVTSDGIFDPTNANIGLNTIQLRYTEGDCIYNAAIDITIFQAPSADFSVTSPICVLDSSTITYTGNGASVAAYDWNFDGGTNLNNASGSGPYTVSWSSAGTKSISLTVTENGCISTMQTEAVQVDAVIPNPVITCRTTTDSILFSWSPVPGANNYVVNVLDGQTGVRDNFNYNISNLNAGEAVTIEVVASGATVCGAAIDTMTCIASDCPPVTITIDSVPDICKTASTSPLNLNATLSNSGSGTLVWSGPGTTPNGIFDPDAGNVTTGGIANTVTATYTEGNCTYSASIDIYVFDTPIAVFSATSPVCTHENSAIEFRGLQSAGNTYTWGFDGGLPANVSGPGPHFINWNSPGNKTITLTVEANGCRSDEAVDTVTVEAPLLPPQISCTSTTSSIEFNWLPVSGATDYAVNLLQGTAGTYNGAFTYLVNNLNVGDSVTIEVIANSLSPCGPVRDTLQCFAKDCPPVTVAIDSIPPVCLYQNTPAFDLNSYLQITGSSGNNNIQWGGGPYVTLDGRFFPFNASTGVHKVFATVRESGCTYIDSAFVTVFGIPNSDFFSSPAICITDTAAVQFTGIAASDATFHWDFGGGAEITNNSGAGPYSLIFDRSGADTLSLWIEADGCVSDTTEFPLEVYDTLPVPQISCTSTTSSIEFNWLPVSGATDYAVNLLQGTAGTYNGAFTYLVNNLNVGDSVTIEVIANSMSPCGPARDTIQCFAKDCPPVTVAIDSIPPVCLYQNTPAFDLNSYLQITGSSGNNNIQWSGGPYVTLDGRFFPFNASTGVHKIIATVRESGCTYIDSAFVTVFGIPNSDFFSSPAICITDTAAVQFTGIAASDATFHWDFGGGTEITNNSGAGPYSLIFDRSGADTLSLWIEADGCISDTTVFPLEVYDTLPVPQISCSATETSVTFNWDSGTYTILQSPMGGQITNLDSTGVEIKNLLPNQQVTVAVLNSDTQSPCPAVADTLTCFTNDCPAVIIEIEAPSPICLYDTASVIDFSGSFTISGNVTTGNTTWRGPAISADGIFDPKVAGTGMHTLVLTYEELTCTYRDSTVMVVNSLPIADAGTDRLITCTDTIVPIGGPGNNSNPPVVEYSWSGGNVFDSTISQTETDEVNTFILTATNPQTGCIASDSVTVGLSDEVPQLSVTVDNISCFGRNDGTLRINGVAGGTPPIEFSINGGNFSPQTIYEDLGPGTYATIARDALGCEDEVTLVIEEPDSLSVSLGIAIGENPLQFGDSVLLEAILSVSPNLITNLQWSPGDNFPQCDEINITNCLTQWVSPTGQAIYGVRVETGPGCADDDRIKINVNKQRPVYIPSGFSPINGDKINDVFQIFADPSIVPIVRSFLIFDRWGEVVFENYAFEPSLEVDIQNGWDGTFRGQMLPPAVFVYFVEVEYFDGSVEILKGDITLK